jgi:hypothetical protein
MQILIHPIAKFSDISLVFLKTGPSRIAKIINMIVLPILLSFEFVFLSLPRYFIARLLQSEKLTFIALQKIQKQQKVFHHLFQKRTEIIPLLLSSEIQKLENCLNAWLLDSKKEEIPQKIQAIKVFKRAFLEKSNKIRLAHFYLSSIPDIFHFFKDLEALDLQVNPIKTLPPSLFELKNLKTLLLADTQIQDFPSDFKKLTQLEEIGLEMNGLNSFPSFITELSQLKKIYLDYNLIKTLPVKLKELKGLEILSLSYNQIEELPKSLGTIRALQEIDLTHNHIVIFPKEILDAFFYKRVILKQNPFSYESTLLFSKALKIAQKEKDCFSSIESDVEACLKKPLFLTLSFLKSFSDHAGVLLSDEACYHPLLNCPLINRFLIGFYSYSFFKVLEKEKRQAYATSILSFVDKMLQSPLFFDKVDHFIDFFLDKKEQEFELDIKLIQEFILENN